MQTVHIDHFNGCRIHFVGIGGISMSGLAEILLKRGYAVTGSDLRESHITQKLRKKGAKVFIGHDSTNVQGAQLVVHTAAVKEDNPEIQEARKRNIPVIDRATLLGQVMEAYPYSIAVSGTHGKTTTTSMLSTVLLRANLDPTILVGGELDAIGGNVRVGSSPYFITEACEYVESFLHFKPYLAIILNIDADHLDYFKDIDHIYQAFTKFAHLVPQNGYAVGCIDDPLVAKLLSQLQCNTVSYGINGPSDWKACDIHYSTQGTACFKAYYRGEYVGDVALSVPGKHNVYNALAATAAAHALGIPFEVIKEALADYRGTHRRLEFKGKRGDVTIIDDYAHHPTEIKATLETVQYYPHNRIWCVFQPHTYTRTKKLFNLFVHAFKQADRLIITDIYAAREKDTGEIHSRDLVKAIQQTGQPCMYLQTFEEIVDYLKDNISPGDIVITVGAGDVYRVGDMLLNSVS